MGSHRHNVLSQLKEAGLLNGKGNGVDFKTIDINVEDCASSHCRACGNMAFQKVVEIYHIPAMLSKTGFEKPIEVHKYFCIRCGKVNHLSDLAKLDAKTRNETIKEAEKQSEVNNAPI